MLLRSCSTPVLGSLLPSSSCCSTPHFHESPNHHHIEKAPISLSSPSFLHGLSQNQDNSIIRRARSDGNLHSLLSSSTSTSNHHHRANQVLDTIPSFSIYNNNNKDNEYDTDDDDDEEEEFEVEETGIGGSIRGGLSFMGHDQNLNLVENSIGGSNGLGETTAAALPLFLARGLGIDRPGSGFMNAAGGGGSGGGGCNVTTGNGGERFDVENHYKRMVEEDPNNALFLRNYAQFLYQTKGDTQRAEEYYSRAILAEPGDGEILLQYAKLVWELHEDKERASCYFEQAVQATPTDSHVLAAYANFLWEAEDDCEGIGDEGQLQDSPVHQDLSEHLGVSLG